MVEIPLNPIFPFDGSVSDMELIDGDEQPGPMSDVLVGAVWQVAAALGIARWIVVLDRGGQLERVAAHDLDQLLDHLGVAVMIAGRPRVFVPPHTGDPVLSVLAPSSTLVIWPLVGSGCTGYMAGCSEEPRSYTGAELALAHSLLQSAMAERGPQRSRESDDLLGFDDVLLRIASSLDVASTLQAITDAAAEIAGVPYASLWMRGRDGSYQAVAAHGVSLDSLQGVQVPTSGSIFAEIQRTREPVQIAHYRQEVPLTGKHEETVRATGVQAALGVPLVQDDLVIGALYIGSRLAHTFPSDVVRAVQRLAVFALMALQNAERFSRLESEHSQLQAYVDAIPDAIFILNRQGQLVLGNAVAHQDWDGVAEELAIDVPVRFHGLRVRYAADPAAVFQRVMESGQSASVMLETEDGRQHFELYFSPLPIEQGVLVTIRDVTGPLGLGQERSREHLLAELLELAALMNSDPSTGVLLERVVEAAMALVGATAGTLGLVEGDSIVFRRFHQGKSGWVDFDVRVKRGQGVPGYVWLRQQPYISNDCSQDPNVVQQYRTDMGFKRLVFVPVMSREGEFVGALGVYDPAEPRLFGTADAEALQLLAHQAAIALENARLGELKDEFLSVVSHELKTPVTSIKGFSQLLQRKLSPEALSQADRYLRVINNHADRLNHLISDLLDLSRLQTGRLIIELQDLDYRTLILDVIEDMKLVHADHAITVYMPDTVRVRGNAERLRQVLTNLIDNAAKYGPIGGEIHLTVEEHPEGIATYVCDEGEGLPAEEGTRIFRPYYQLQRHRNRRAGGLGLGLWISSQIIESHGGRIWLDTTDHTSFCFVIPRG